MGKEKNVNISNSNTERLYCSYLQIRVFLKNLLTPIISAKSPDFVNVKAWLEEFGMPEAIMIPAGFADLVANRTLNRIN